MHMLLLPWTLNLNSGTMAHLVQNVSADSKGSQPSPGGASPVSAQPASPAALPVVQPASAAQ